MTDDILAQAAQRRPTPVHFVMDVLGDKGQEQFMSMCQSFADQAIAAGFSPEKAWLALDMFLIQTAWDHLVATTHDGVMVELTFPDLTDPPTSQAVN